MTTFKTDYNNSELLDQELTIEELESVAGGGRERAELSRRLFFTETDDWDEPEALAEWKEMYTKYLKLV